jgi:hypothetical protein
MSKNTSIADLINYISVDGSGNVVLSTGQLVATQNYVTTAVSNLVASAPSTLDTLNELATALGNDANFATTVATSIGTKLNLSGGTLTGALNGTSALFTDNLRTDTGLGIKYGSFVSTTGYLNLFSARVGSTFTINFKDGTGGFESALSFTNSANRNYTFPNADGTIALTSNLSSYLPLTGGTLTGALNGTSATFSSIVTSNRFYGTYSSVLNTHTTVNPSSNVLLMSGPNDRDAWIFLDQADTSSNWGIYHRQIDSAVGLLEANSIGFIGGGASGLKAFIGLNTGNGYFSGTLRATSPGVDGNFSDAFIGVYSSNPNETNAIQTSVSSIASSSGFRLQASNGAGSSARTTVADFYRDRIFFYNNTRIVGTGNILSFDTAGSGGSTTLGTVSDFTFKIANNRGNGSAFYLGPYDVSIENGGVVRMTVNASGHVTRPFQPAFLAYSTGFTVTAGGWYNVSNAITTESYDIGSNYSGGRFTAPVAGRYLFYASGWASINANGERYAWCARVNDGGLFYIGGGNYCLTDSPLAGYSIVYNLSAGDYVDLWVFSAAGGTWGGGSHSVWWGGYLL